MTRTVFSLVRLLTECETESCQCCTGWALRVKGQLIPNLPFSLAWYSVFPVLLCFSVYYRLKHNNLSNRYRHIWVSSYMTKMSSHFTFFSILQKTNSWTYNFVEVSGHILESSQTWGFRIQYLHYKPLLLNGVWGVKSVSRGDCEEQGGKLLSFCPNYVQEFGLQGPILCDYT